MARKTAEQKESERIDNAIEAAWYKHCSGVQVNIMDIGKIFKECRAALPRMTIEDAVKAAAAKYSQNARAA